MASPRAKNTASPKEVAKLFRGANVTQLPPEENYMVADLSKVAEKYEDLLSDIIRCTPRPNVTLLQDACCLVFRGVTKADCKAFLPAADLHNQNVQGEEECHHWQEAYPLSVPDPADSQDAAPC